MGTSETRSRLGRVAAVGVMGAVAFTFGGLVPALLGVGIHAALRVSPPPERVHVCGSCGQCFDSRGVLRAHRGAVHARAFAMHSS